MHLTCPIARRTQNLNFLFCFTINNIQGDRNKFKDRNSYFVQCSKKPDKKTGKINSGISFFFVICITQNLKPQPQLNL